MQLNNYFALKVGLAVSVLSSTAFHFCAMIFADSLDPFLDKFNNDLNDIQRRKTRQMVGMIGAGFGFFVGAGVSFECYGVYKLVEIITTYESNTITLPKPSFNA